MFRVVKYEFDAHDLMRVLQMTEERHGMYSDFTDKVLAAGDATLPYLVIFTLVNNACEVLRSHSSK